MRVKTLGLILIIVGLIGGVVAYTSGLLTHAVEYYKVGITSNVIQVLGLVGVFADKD